MARQITSDDKKETQVEQTRAHRFQRHNIHGALTVSSRKKDVLLAQVARLNQELTKKDETGRQP